MYCKSHVIMNLYKHRSILTFKSLEDPSHVCSIEARATLCEMKTHFRLSHNQFKSIRKKSLCHKSNIANIHRSRFSYHQIIKEARAKYSETQTDPPPIHVPPSF